VPRISEFILKAEAALPSHLVTGRRHERARRIFASLTRESTVTPTFEALALVTGRKTALRSVAIKAAIVLLTAFMAAYDLPGMLRIIRRYDLLDLKDDWGQVEDAS
jgi:hypothetical protein